jgi:BMFP domain-containing protein YqiC
MKTKTLIELLTLYSSLYILAREHHVFDRLQELSDKGKQHFNSVAAEELRDKNGNEMEFVDKLFMKANQAREELEQKIEELIAAFYQKVNIAHLDELKALQLQLEKSQDKSALLEARLNHLEAKA